MAPDHYINVKKAARWLGIPERTVTHLCRNGRIEGATQYAGFSGKWLIPISGLQKMRTDPAEPGLLVELATIAS